VLLPLYFSSVLGGVTGAFLVRGGLSHVLWTGAAISLLAALLTAALPAARSRPVDQTASPQV
jgi:hypothetical protein